MQLLTNAFELPVDGWYQISSLGEFSHNSTGLLQIIDEESCRSMVDSFTKLSATPNFPGVLIDFDHFSLDHSKPSEAAGWISQLEHRPNGLWAQIRWSDRGEEAVRGGRYRFISPVWRQDECMDLGNKRVRPVRLVNAAVTNDPNISGMVPLSNKREPEPTHVSIALPNRTSLHFRRGLVLGNAGIYLHPRTGQPIFLANYNGSPLTDEQRKAMFARGGGRGGGGGRGSSGSASGGGTSSGGGSSGGGSSPPKSTPQAIFTPKRDSDARVDELRRQRDALMATAGEPPEKPDYSLTDTRALQRSLLMQGASINDMRAAVADADAENRRRKDALRDIRKGIAEKFSDPVRRRRELAKVLDKQDRDYQKQTLDWQKQNRGLDKKLAVLDAQINMEQILGEENQRGATIKEHNEGVRQTEKQTAEQQRALRRQIEADKAAIRKEEAAQRAAGRKNTDPATAYRQELNKRRIYWQAASRGDWDQAQNIFPGADHEANKRDLESLAPPSHSKTNQKAYASALKQIQYEAP